MTRVRWIALALASCASGAILTCGWIGLTEAEPPQYAVVQLDGVQAGGIQALLNKEAAQGYHFVGVNGSFYIFSR